MWRREAPHVLAALLRRHGDLADCEDAVQLALLAAAEQWPREGLPEAPRAWLRTVATRRLIDAIRADSTRREREERAARLEGPLRAHGLAAADGDMVTRSDGTVIDGASDEGEDLLPLLLLCAHPALTPASQTALMLRAVGGLRTAEIAACFFVPEPTMAQRISRAKARVRAHGARLPAPTGPDLPLRLHAVRHAVSALYAQDHSLAERGRGTDPLLGGAAVRVARALHSARPTEPESAGLLSLLLLTHARAPARLDIDGEIVPLTAQDRSRWDHHLAREGIDLLERTLPVGEVGPFQLQAAIAAFHAEAPTSEAKDWPQILVLYRMLAELEPSPAVLLGLAVATAEVDGPDAGLALLAQQPALTHRHEAVSGHLLSRLGREEQARAAFLRAAERTRSPSEQRYLRRLAGLA